VLGEIQEAADRQAFHTASKQEASQQVQTLLTEAERLATILLLSEAALRHPIREARRFRTEAVPGPAQDRLHAGAGAARPGTHHRNLG